MNVTFPCPNCGQASRAEVTGDEDTIGCAHCGRSIKLPAGAAGQITRCLACPSRDLFVRKDFPQRLGVTMVVIGIAASTVTWGLGEPLWTYAILFATALIDLILYLIMPDALMCYRCGAIYRNVSLAEHGPFDLETHERYRQQAARLGDHSSHYSVGNALRGGLNGSADFGTAHGPFSTDDVPDHHPAKNSTGLG